MDKLHDTLEEVVEETGIGDVEYSVRSLPCVASVTWDPLTTRHSAERRADAQSGRQRNVRPKHAETEQADLAVKPDFVRFAVPAFTRRARLTERARGPKRYDWDDEDKVWFYHRNDERLDDLLQRELTEAFGKAIRFELGDLE